MSAPVLVVEVRIRRLTDWNYCYYALIRGEVASDARHNPKQNYRGPKGTEGSGPTKRFFLCVSLLPLWLVSSVIPLIDFLVTGKYPVLTRERRAIQKYMTSSDGSSSKREVAEA